MITKKEEEQCKMSESTASSNSKEFADDDYTFFTVNSHNEIRVLHEHTSMYLIFVQYLGKNYFIFTSNKHVVH